MALSQNSLVSWADIRNLYDKVNAERARLLREAVANRAVSPTQGSKVLASTPANLRTLASGAINGNTFARTDLASTLTSINNLANPAVGDLLRANGLSSLSGYLDTIRAYNPRLTTGTPYTNFNATYYSAFGAFDNAFRAASGTFNAAFGAFDNAFRAASGTFNAAFGAFNNSFRAASGTFNGSFGTYQGTYHSSFRSNGTFHGTFFSTFCGNFSESGSCYCISRFTYGSGDNTRTHRGYCTRSFTSHSSFESGFHTRFGTGFTSFTPASGTQYARFTAGFSGFTPASGTQYARFSSFAAVFYASYCVTFNSSFCPAEFCPSFNAAAFFNTL